MLRYCLFGLGIGAAALALPVGLAGRWSALAWAVQGAMLLGAGSKAEAGRRWPPGWRWGLALQAGAWGLFLSATGDLDVAAARDAKLWLGFLVLAGAALYSALALRADARYALLSALFLAVATLWLLAAAWSEIVLRSQGRLQTWLLAGSALAGAVLLRALARRLRWGGAGKAALALPPIAGLALLLMPWSGAAGPAPAELLLGALLLGGSLPPGGR